MTETRPKVSVIICAYSMERFNDVLEAVDSVFAQTLSPHQVIVSVDHNRELESKLKIELPKNVVFAFNDGIKGLSETRNTGIRAAAGDIIAFMDDDAVAEGDWLEKLVRPFENSNVAVVGGKINPCWLTGSRPGWFPEELDWIFGCTYAGMPQDSRRVRNVIGCNMAFHSDVFRRIGLFSPAVGRTSKAQGIGEDSELCLRLSREMPKAVIVYEPAAIVHHKVPAWRVNTSYLLRRSFEEGYHKSTVKKLSSSTGKEPLSSEYGYLRFLLIHAIPGRLKRIYRPSVFLQAGAIISCIAATGAGYAAGLLKNPNAHEKVGIERLA